MDPLVDVVQLLRPGAPSSKVVTATGPWRVTRSEYGEPFYCVVLEGSCRLAVDAAPPVTLAPGDFVLIPAADRFTMSSLEPCETETTPVAGHPGEFRIGPENQAPELRALIGYCQFASPDADLLVAVLPQLVHIRGDERLRILVELVKDESRSARPAREVVLARLLEVLLIEALRSTSNLSASAGLVRGLHDERLATAIRRMHDEPTRPWTVAELANEAAMSRSAFFVRFTDALGVAPMEYLLRWRMALAKVYLRENGGDVGDAAERVGYSSASTFSVAFRRSVGLPPGRYARDLARSSAHLQRQETAV